MKSSIELTSTSRLHATRLGVVTALAAMELGAWVQVGDVIEIAPATGQDAFIVRLRRVVVASNGIQSLVFQLDHPPRL
jgi:hypothetical protein